ncbi:hypothetical protein Tco_0922388 [Tanacetum coccineum]|uniref:Reverse transcriptase domain-containing protein n=1 Tax=Tanacetum coccineum TaxID=301880 RepID=A0ABQ5CYX0_9ASTR
MEEELYNLIVKGNDLKPYVRRFQELTVLCPNMVPNNDKLLEAFIGGLPRSIEGNVECVEKLCSCELRAGMASNFLAGICEERELCIRGSVSDCSFEVVPICFD